MGFATPPQTASPRKRRPAALLIDSLTAQYDDQTPARHHSFGCCGEEIPVHRTFIDFGSLIGTPPHSPRPTVSTAPASLSGGPSIQQSFDTWKIVTTTSDGSAASGTSCAIMAEPSSSCSSTRLTVTTDCSLLQELDKVKDDEIRGKAKRALLSAAKSGTLEAALKRTLKGAEDLPDVTYRLSAISMKAAGYQHLESVCQNPATGYWPQTPSPRSPPCEEHLEQSDPNSFLPSDLWKEGIRTAAKGPVSAAWEQIHAAFQPAQGWRTRLAPTATPATTDAANPSVATATATGGLSWASSVAQSSTNVSLSAAAWQKLHAPFQPHHRRTAPPAAKPATDSSDQSAATTQAVGVLSKDPAQTTEVKALPRGQAVGLLSQSPAAGFLPKGQARVSEMVELARSAQANAGPATPPQTKLSVVASGELSNAAEFDAADDDDSSGDGDSSDEDLGLCPTYAVGVPLPSAGSALHSEGTCKRCCFFPKGRCNNGYDCQFCHFAHEKRKPKNKKKKKKRRKNKVQTPSNKQINAQGQILTCCAPSPPVKVQSPHSPVVHQVFGDSAIWRQPQSRPSQLVCHSLQYVPPAAKAGLTQAHDCHVQANDCHTTVLPNDCHAQAYDSLAQWPSPVWPMMQQVYTWPQPY